MRTWTTPFLFTAVLFVTLGGAHGAAAAAEPTKAASISVEHAWIRLLPAGLPHAAYAVIRNEGDDRMQLTGADSDAYASIMLHESSATSGVQHMHMVNALDIPAHASAALAPGGYHLMLMQPTRILQVGDAVTMVLHFADGTDIEAVFAVRPANSMGH